MASNAWLSQEHDPIIHGSRKLKVTFLASEWGCTKGGLSTINRELAIQLTKFSYVEVTFFLPKCSDEDKKIADGHGISILEAAKLPSFNELDQLFLPQNLRIAMWLLLTELNLVVKLKSSTTLTNASGFKLYMH